jgi:hypothetical protein
MNIELLEKTDECVFEVKDKDKTYTVKVWMNLSNGRPYNAIVKDNATGEIISDEVEETIVDQVLLNWLRLVA